MAVIFHLGSALDLLEAVLVGSVALGIAAPNPPIGFGIGANPDDSITIVDGLFVGRALDTSDFLVDKRVVVNAPSTVNTNRSTSRDYDIVDDTVVLDLVTELPLIDKTTDQRSGRFDAATVDNKIKGRLVSDEVEALGLKFIHVITTRRLALDSGSSGSAPFGSARHLITTSTFTMTRIDSLTGGPA